MVEHLLGSFLKGGRFRLSASAGKVTAAAKQPDSPGTKTSSRVSAVC